MNDQPYRPPVNKGNLHRNQYKEKDNQPDYRGSLNVCGEVAELGGWINTNKNGGNTWVWKSRRQRGMFLFLCPKTKRHHHRKDQASHVQASHHSMRICRFEQQKADL